MIRIDEPTRGRFGNKIFHYNTLMQLASISSLPTSCIPWEGSQYFEGICGYVPSSEPSYDITCRDILELPHDNLISRLHESGDAIVHGYALHGPFFRISHRDPREFLQLRKEYIPQFENDCTYVGIHIRGGDFRGADGNQGREVHPYKFYREAIDYINDCTGGKKKFFVCTDDVDASYAPYAKTLEYLKRNDLLVTLGSSHRPEDYILDFTALCYADILVAGSSTFALAAGMLGKRKKVIHWKPFFKQFLDGGDWYSSWGNEKFYHDALHIRSEFYEILWINV